MSKNAPHLEKRQAPAPNPDLENITPDELGSLVEAQGEVIAEQADEIAALKGKVESMLASLPAGKVRPRLGSFTLDGQEYRVLHGVQIVVGATIRTLAPEDIERDEAVQRELIALGSGAIQPII